MLEKAAGDCDCVTQASSEPSVQMKHDGIYRRVFGYRSQRRCTDADEFISDSDSEVQASHSHVKSQVTSWLRQVKSQVKAVFAAVN